MRASPARSAALVLAWAALPLTASLARGEGVDVKDFLLKQASRKASPPKAPALDSRAIMAHAREFVENALDGKFSQALAMCTEAYRKELGDTGLARLRDLAARHGEAQFIGLAVEEEEGLAVVHGVLAMAGRRTMVVHVVFRGGEVEHLFSRWGRR